MKSKFRGNLRNELNYQDMKVKELSKKSGISKATLECYLRTQATEPSAKNAVKIAQTLGVSVEYLVTGASSEHEGIKAFPTHEIRMIIQQLESLNHEQRKAILKLIKTFKGQKPV